MFVVLFASTISYSDTLELFGIACSSPPGFYTIFTRYKTDIKLHPIVYQPGIIIGIAWPIIISIAIGINIVILGLL